MTKNSKKNEVTVFISRQQDVFQIWLMRVELIWKQKRVWGEVSIATTEGAVAADPQAADLAAEMTNGNGSDDDSVPPLED